MEAYDPARIHIAQGAEGLVVTINALYVHTSEDAHNLSPDFLKAHLRDYEETLRRKAELRSELIEQGCDDPGE